MTYWLDYGIDGFRIDASAFLVENKSLPDEPLSNWGYEYPNYFYLNHLYTIDDPLSFEIMREWKEHINNYTEAANDDRRRVIFSETYVNMSYIVEWYESGSDVPFNFFFIKNGEVAHPAVVDTASDIVSIIDDWMSQMPTDKTANWVVSRI